MEPLRNEDGEIATGREKQMLLSNHANPNSMPARHARMMDQARSSALYRDLPSPAPKPAVALDVKGHVSHVGHLERGYRVVRFAVRHGATLSLMLDVRDEDLVPRLKAASDAGECIEIIYEAHPGSIFPGRIITIS